MQMGMGSPGQVKLDSEPCENFDLEAPTEKIKLILTQAYLKVMG